MSLLGMEPGVDGDTDVAAHGAMAVAQAAMEQARVRLAIAHWPGAMVVTDRPARNQSPEACIKNFQV